jgi:hypothetical protein
VLLLPVVLLTVSAVSSATDPCAAGDECEEFWYPTHDSPPGSRMKCHAGKIWPDVARPCGPSEPCIHRYHTAHYWPNPYRWQDRGSVRAYLEAQRSAGWMTATTLYESHFDEVTNELNQAGLLHLKWIMIHAPVSRRTTYVQAADSASVNQIRLASVQTAATDLLGNHGCPVMLRVCQQYGAPAQEVDLVRRAYLASWPTPRIPVHSSGQANNLGGKSLDAGEGGP